MVACYQDKINEVELRRHQLARYCIAGFLLIAWIYIYQSLCSLYWEDCCILQNCQVIRGLSRALCNPPLFFFSSVSLTMKEKSTPLMNDEIQAPEVRVVIPRPGEVVIAITKYYMYSAWCVHCSFSFEFLLPFLLLPCYLYFQSYSILGLSWFPCFASAKLSITMLVLLTIQ